MKIEDIFGSVASRMVEGVMFHDNLYLMFTYLGMQKFANEHKLQYDEESDNYKDICKFFVLNENKLPPKTKVEIFDFVPTEWYSLNRHEIGYEERVALIESLFRIWIEWEQGTKKIFSQAYNELTLSGEYSYADKIMLYLNDVQNELARANKEYLEFKASGHDMPSVVF